MDRRFLPLLTALLLCVSTAAQLRVSPDRHYFVTAGGKPFFWLGDTAWELFHRLSRAEASDYLQDRARKGFTVIQAVLLAELDGLQTPSVQGHLPLINNDPARPNEAYFRDVDAVVEEAGKLGLYMALLPSWGDKWNKKWGVGPEVFTPDNARTFGAWVGNRYKNFDHIIWVLGGDRDPEEPQDFALIRAMAEGLRSAVGSRHLFTFHPQGGKSSSDFFPQDEWMDFHLSQTGHSSESRNYTFNRKHRAMKPARPHLDGEPRYEDHPNQFNPGKFGWMDEFDARQTAYWSLLSGACGHTYGNHNIWQMYTEERKPVSWARTHWRTALQHEGAIQVGYMRRLFESRPWQRLQPDTALILSDNPEGPAYVVAARSQDGDFLMAYLPYGFKVKLRTTDLKGRQLRGWLFNPRDGRTLPIAPFPNTGALEFTPHSEGRGSDWVLVIDDAARNYPDPAVQGN